MWPLAPDVQLSHPALNDTFLKTINYNIMIFLYLRLCLIHDNNQKTIEHFSRFTVPCIYQPIIFWLAQL